ncbi:MAG: hypothetical protein SVU32_00180 [Candidatus Nanohaloarchaea archaeon]|nr:hypothetical protein [Candidatus Nanohaloarchaea archaeon]
MTTGTMELDALQDDRRVLIFYSSDEQPEILDFYEEALEYLDETGIENEVIDIAESAERARQHDILTTPAVVVESGDEVEKYTGIMEGLKDLLLDDLYGRSVLHEAGFKQGRQLAQEHGLAGLEDESKVEEVLNEFFTPGCDRVTLEAYDPDDQRARVALEPSDSGHGKVVHEQFGAVLEGFFMEIFGTNDASEEAKCVREGDPHCEYVIKGVEAEDGTDADQGS